MLRPGRTVRNGAVVLAAFQRAVVHVGHETRIKRILAVVRHLHRTALRDHEVAHGAALGDEPEQPAVGLPVEDRVALAVEDALEGPDPRETFYLAHVDIGFQVHLAAFVLPCGDVAARIDGLGEGREVRSGRDAARGSSQSYRHGKKSQ